MLFATRLKTLREQHKMTQEELAGKLNITRQAIGNYEQGTRFPKDERILREMADLFDISMDDLFGRNYKSKIYADTENIFTYDRTLEEDEIYEDDRAAVLEELVNSVNDLSLETIRKITKTIEIFKK